MKQVTPNEEIFWVPLSIKLQQALNEKRGYSYLSDAKFGDHDYIMLPDCDSFLRQNKCI